MATFNLIVYIWQHDLSHFVYWASLPGQIL